MGFGEAVDGGFLTDYQVLVIAVAEDPVLENLDMIGVGEGLRPLTAREAVKLAGCWDALADPTTRTTQNRITGATHPQMAACRAIAFTNTIKNSLGVEKYWGPVTDMMAPSARTGSRCFNARSAMWTDRRMHWTGPIPSPGSSVATTTADVGS